MGLEQSYREAREALARGRMDRAQELLRQAGRELTGIGRARGFRPRPGTASLWHPASAPETTPSLVRAAGVALAELAHEVESRLRETGRRREAVRRQRHLRSLFEPGRRAEDGRWMDECA